MASNPDGAALSSAPGPLAFPRPALDDKSVAVLDMDTAIARARQLAQNQPRFLLGITGPPGSGKSTLGTQLIQALGGEGVLVPMDGFHLAQRELRRAGLEGSKGTPITFDAHGYVALLRRLRARVDPVVYAPAFDRRIEEPVAGAIPIPAAVPLVLTEGNYLLMDKVPWNCVREMVSEVWYCDIDDDVRRERLLARHQQFGKSAKEAVAWIGRVDEANAGLVARTRGSANFAVVVP